MALPSTQLASDSDRATDSLGRQQEGVAVGMKAWMADTVLLALETIWGRIGFMGE